MAKQFEDGKPITITLGPDVRFLWPYVFEKRQNDDGEDKYEVDICIPYDNKKAIVLFEDAVDAAIDRGYSGDLRAESTFKKGTKESALNLPLKDGADKAADDDKYGWMYENYMYAKARTTRRPTILDANGQQILDPADFRMGAKGAVSITVFPYNRKSQGVGVQLNHIMQLVESDFEGGGYTDPETAFAEYLGGGNSRPSRSRTRGEDDAPAPRASRSRTRDTESDERRPARGSRTRERDRGGSDDPMFM